MKKIIRVISVTFLICASLLLSDSAVVQASSGDINTWISSPLTFFENRSGYTESHALFLGTSLSTTTITSDSPDPSSPGQLVTINVNVSGSGPIPTGIVNITGADTNCIVVLSYGNGSCNAVFNTSGSKNLTAVYNGDAYYGASSDIENHLVSKGTTTPTITFDIPDPSSPGQAVAVNVIMSGAGTVPTGTVVITGADTNCTITLSGGSGSCNVIFNTAGGRVLTAVYSGDSNYYSSWDTENHLVAVTRVPSTTTITADTPDPSVPGQSVLVSASVSGAGSVATGVVVITGADTNCTIALSNGSGSCSVVFNTTGVKILTATYNGDSIFNNSSDTESHSVSNGRAPSSTTITTDTPDPSMPGQVVSVTVAVAGAGSIPTGIVDIIGADSNCTIALTGGIGTCNVIFTVAGSWNLAAVYSGDSNYATSSDIENHLVSKGSSVITIIADNPDPSLPGQAVTVSVSMSGSGLVPTGTVVITGTDMNCTITLAGGNGHCDVIFSTAGNKILTAVFSGDSNYNSSWDTESHVVSANAATITPTVATATATPSITYTPSRTSTPIPTATGTLTNTPTPTSTLTISPTRTHTPTYTPSGIATGTSTSTTTPTIAPTTTFTKTITPTNTQTGSSSIIMVDSPDPSAPGQSVEISVVVNGTAPIPTGTVTITGADANCTIALSSGRGRCNVVFNKAGSKNLTAVYSGDANHAPNSAIENHTVIMGSTTTTITSDLPDPSEPGQSVEVSVSVSGAGTVKTGTVIVTGADQNCTITLSGGNGSCFVVFSSAGEKILTAVYSGDSNYYVSWITESHTVAITPPTITITPTFTATTAFTETNTPTPTATFTYTPTGTAMPTFTPTPSLTSTPTVTNAATSTATPTHTSTSTISETATYTPTPSFTFTPSSTNPPTATATSTITATDTITSTATFTSVPAATGTATFTPSPTETSTPTFTNTSTLTLTPTDTITNTPTQTSTFTFTPTETRTATPSLTASFTPTRTNTLTLTPTRTSTATYTSTSTPVRTSTRTSTPVSGSRPLKYYLVDRVLNHADYATLAGWGIDTAVVSFDVNGSSTTWRTEFVDAAKYGIDIVIWPSDWTHPRPDCPWEAPYPVSTNGDISRVKNLLDVASQYTNFIGIVNAHESFWTCYMTFDEMAGLKTQLKAYALSKGRDIKVWNYINSIYYESMFPANQVARVMDVAVTWKHCAGGAEGSCDVGSSSALAQINRDRTRLNSLGLDGVVDLVYIMQTFTAGSKYSVKFTLSQLESYSCEFLNTSALDGFGYYTWDAGWWPDLHSWSDLQPAVPYIYNNCVYRGP